MKYSSLIFVSAFTLSGLALASGDNTLNKEEESDIRVACIEAAIADELEDDQKNAFVATCVQEAIAARQKSLGNKG